MEDLPIRCFSMLHSKVLLKIVDMIFAFHQKKFLAQKDPMVNKDLNLYDVFDIESKNTISLSDNKIVQESGFSFDENIFNRCEENVDLIGYFQTENILNILKTKFALTLLFLMMFLINVMNL